jgi:uncharacterized membrane protein YeaQ/YmgE (transglycosylase-associated protein family)
MEEQMGIISWIVLGAIAGYLAGFLVKGDEGLGVIGHIVLGIVGAVVGGFLARVVTGVDPIDGALDISSIVAAVIGAVIVKNAHRPVGVLRLVGRRMPPADMRLQGPDPGSLAATIGRNRTLLASTAPRWGGAGDHSTNLSAWVRL